MYVHLFRLRSAPRPPPSFLSKHTHTHFYNPHSTRPNLLPHLTLPYTQANLSFQRRQSPLFFLVFSYRFHFRFLFRLCCAVFEDRVDPCFARVSCSSVVVI